MRRNWLPIALAASVGINLLIAGVFIGQRLRDVPPMLENPAFAIGRAVQQLDEGQREALLPQVREHYRNMRPHLRELRQYQHELRRAFNAEQLNVAAIDAAHNQLTHELTEIQNISHHTLKALLQELSGPQREAFLRALDTVPAGHPHHRPGRPEARRPPPRGHSPN